jgi:phosphoribosyl-ATP pyrophosphohydrolase
VVSRIFPVASANLPDYRNIFPARPLQRPPQWILGEFPVSDAQQHILAQLMAVIEDRKINPPAKSYTTTLFAGGVAKIGEKISEEAAEVIEAAGEPGEAGRTHLVREAGDLVYHLFVMLGYRDVKLTEVEAEIAKRFGISGLDEKANRQK